MAHALSMRGARSVLPEVMVATGSAPEGLVATGSAPVGLVTTGSAPKGLSTKELGVWGRGWGQ